MVVLIANSNIEIVKALLPKAKFVFKKSTENTSFFECTKKTFQVLYYEAKIKNYNPYALMSW